MRIAAVSPVPHAGGAEVLLVDLLAGLVERGHQALLVTCGGRGELSEAAERRGVATAIAPAVRLRSPGAFLRAGAFVRRVALEFGADHLHCNHPHGGLVGVLARLGEASLSVQLLDPPPRADAAAMAMAGVAADFVSISGVTTDAYRRRLRRARSLSTIRPGRDVDGFRAAARQGDANSVLRAAGVDVDARPLVVMVGRLQGFKGIFRLIDASEKVPGATFVHIGPDAPTEPGTRHRAQQTIAERGLSGRVGLAGNVPVEDLAAAVARADLLLHLAEGETFGLALIEAMAVGTPPVAMAAPGPNEILGAGGGVLVPNGQAETVATAVGSLLERRHRLANLGTEARELSETFGTGQMVDAYSAVFGRAVARPAVVSQ